MQMRKPAVEAEDLPCPASSAAEQLRRQGDCHFDLGNVREALACYDAALQRGLNPLENIANRWTALMLLGHFERAWQETDRTERTRLALPRDSHNEHLPKHLRRVWDGVPLAGRNVRVYCYHGLGDTLQFVRLLPKLADVAARIEIECQPQLLELLALSFPTIPFRAPSQQPANDDAVCIELMELAYAFRITLETLPPCVPYLQVPRERIEQRRAELVSLGLKAENFKVGIAWSSGDWNRDRDIALQELARLGSIPNVSLISLQRDTNNAFSTEKLSLAGVLQGEMEKGDIISTAATILCTDLVISVDTMVAHLAGALGQPVCTLLPFHADWRWMIDRNDSPWYPTMLLFRQARPGDWSQALRKVYDRLRRNVRTHRAASA